MKKLGKNQLRLARGGDDPVPDETAQGDRKPIYDWLNK
jgi:hypothetical protein